MFFDQKKNDPKCSSKKKGKESKEGVQVWCQSLTWSFNTSKMPDYVREYLNNVGV